MNIYGISQGAQRELVDKLCFGKCGKINVGAIKFCDAWFMPCSEDKCEYEEKTLNVETVVDGKNLIMRKLKTS